MKELLFQKSKRKNKKYDVYNENGEYITSFGDKRFQHFKDKIGMYSHLNHNDEKRRKAYRKRHAGVKLKDGSRAIDKKLSPAWFSYKLLW